MSTVPATPDLTATPPDPPPANPLWPVFLFREAAQQVTGLAENALQPYGLSLRQLGVLIAIEAEPGQNQREVGERLRIDRTTVVALADDLERAGLLERRRGSDRRMFELHLTAEGAARLAELTELTTAVHDRFLAGLSAEERSTLRRLLVKVLAG